MASYRDYQRERNIRRATAKIESFFHKQERAFDLRELRAIDKTHNYGAGLSKKIRGAGTKPKGDIYTAITDNGLVQARAKLKTERVETRALIQSRETLQDYITKTDNIWLVEALRKH